MGSGKPQAKKLRKEHRCETCAKSFERSDNLNQHRCVHNGEKPFRCTRCEKKFSDKSALNRLLKAHNKRAAERTFTCNTCGESFHSRAPYNAHIRTTHSIAPNRKRPAAAEKPNDAVAAKKYKRTGQGSASTVSEPSATPQSTPQVSTATAGSSWEADPVLFPSNLVSSSDEDIAQMYRQHWSQICTRVSRHNRLQDWCNFRLSTISPASLCEQLSRIFADQTGFILHNTETGALQYHHPSANNNLVLEQPFSCILMAGWLTMLCRL